MTQHMTKVGVRRGIFFTSDLHIGHANIIRFSNRPFRDVDHMHEVLVNNYNSVVGVDSTCYFLGDVGITNTPTFSEVISKMNGRKVLILGNHDGGVNKMYDAGFDVVLHGATLLIAGQVVTLTHCPLLGIPRENLDGIPHVAGENWHGESREKMRKFSTHYRGQFHLHGHIHSPNGGRSQPVLGRQMDVGVDANNYRPVSLSQVEGWIARTLCKENS